MKVLGEKKKGIAYVYLLLLAIAGLLIFLGVKEIKVITGFIFLVAGIIFIIVGMYMIIDIIRYPQNIIVYKEIDNTLILNNRVIVSVEFITDVSFINARSKSITWKWGVVVIRTTGATYKCKYVKDCEKVAKTLMKLMYKKEL